MSSLDLARALRLLFVKTCHTDVISRRHQQRLERQKAGRVGRIGVSAAPVGGGRFLLLAEPKEETAKKDPPPPPPPPPPKVDEKATSSWDPMRSSGQSYEAYRQAYLGHADGTPVGARGTSVAAGASNPRNTNPGREQADERPGASTTLHSIGEVTLQADPMRGLKADTRAAKLRSEGGVSSRLIITDPDAEQARPGNAKPKSNGLVR
jgi:hypothetical protein